ncbi:MAG: nuclear transport factor 2 family protein [Chloroflexota bacterium]
MSSESNRRIVEQYWAAMNTNDFQAASEWLHEDFILDWPQSGERIYGRENFATINEQYPAAGLWRFTINRLVADEQSVVTDVSVTDGETVAIAITFSEIRDGKIIRQTEYWPDPFPAPAWRAPFVEIYQPTGGE